jgi:hypothetical protein
MLTRSGFARLRPLMALTALAAGTFAPLARPRAVKTSCALDGRGAGA